MKSILIYVWLSAYLHRALARVPPRGELEMRREMQNNLVVKFTFTTIPKINSR
jgi:hypothetical protein